MRNPVDAPVGKATHRGFPAAMVQLQSGDAQVEEIRRVQSSGSLALIHRGALRCGGAGSFKPLLQLLSDQSVDAPRADSL